MPSLQKPFSEIKVSLKDALESGLSEEEYDKICDIMGREISLTELGLYSALWSEHCSYKNSILALKTLPTDSPLVLAGAGDENAGVLDIGDGLALVFKIESHNHPTAIEPYQGAATGVGGIMRDIFTMGARPLCSLNVLRFGPINEENNRHLLSQAVKGIGDYGNSLGVPVTGGELFFDPSFTKNCLVNAMVLGIVKHENLAFASARGAGNSVFIVGARTGRDGIDGAAFASQDLSDESASKRSAVQVGDPFMEKLLLEATLELLKTKAVIAIQDMGAAGLSCSAAEMSAKGNVGMELNLDDVPLREEGMTPYEIMLSESQERMLLVADPSKEKEIEEIFKRWDLLAVKIGTISDDGNLSIRMKNKLYAKVEAKSLVLGGGAPVYKREVKRPKYLDEKKNDLLNDISPVEDLGQSFISLLGSPNLCSRRQLYEQYDSEVGLASVFGPGSNGGLVRIPGTQRALAVSVDCNSRYVYLDPYLGTMAAVCESARNVASCGAKPIGISNCLNFANPYLAENYYMFSESIRGMREACEILQVPVTGGNVSFYNESEKVPIFPTPSIGMVGLLDNLEWRIPAHFQKEGHSIYLLGDFRPSLGASEYLSYLHNRVSGAVPYLDAKREAKIIEFFSEVATMKLISSAYDLSIGGLALALFRSAYNVSQSSTISFALNFKDKQALLMHGIKTSPEGSKMDQDIIFFGETNSTILISVSPDRAAELEELSQAKALPLCLIGETLSSEYSVFDFDFFRVPIKNAINAYESTLAKVF